MRLALSVLGTAYLLTMGLALLITPTLSAEVGPVFEDPSDPTNPLLYLVLVGIATAVLLAMVKWGKQWLIRGIILLSVASTAWYVLAPLLTNVVSDNVAAIGGGILALGVVGLLVVYPEWWVVDLSAVLVGAGAAGIFGISFSILPSILLLIALAIYDAWAVYRTRHMVRLAEAVLDLRLPILLVAPRRWGYSFREAERQLGGTGPSPQESDSGETDRAEAELERHAYFLGLGDVVVPGVLVVSSRFFLSGLTPLALPPGGMDPALFVSLGVVVGALVGLVVLMKLVDRGKPHAGLPILNGLALLGFLVTALPLYGWGALFA